MTPLRGIVADDEKMARKRVTRLLEQLGNTVLVAECRSGEEVLRHLDPAHVDVALLDVDMPGMNGLETARLAALRGVPVIFLTAHEQHAVEAFQHGAVHYLLKPVDAPALEQALARLRARMLAAQVTQPDTKLPDRVALTVRGDVVLVPPASITHALYDGELVTVFTAARSYITDESLQDLEARVTGQSLMRVHRRALLNLSHVERLRALPTGGYTAVLSGGAEVPVSRQAARDLRKRLGV